MLIGEGASTRDAPKKDWGGGEDSPQVLRKNDGTKHVAM